MASQQFEDILASTRVPWASVLEPRSHPDFGATVLLGGEAGDGKGTRPTSTSHVVPLLPREKEDNHKKQGVLHGAKGNPPQKKEGQQEEGVLAKTADHVWPLRGGAAPLFLRVAVGAVLVRVTLSRRGHSQMEAARHPQGRNLDGNKNRPVALGVLSAPNLPFADWGGGGGVLNVFLGLRGICHWK